MRFTKIDYMMLATSLACAIVVLTLNPMLYIFLAWVLCMIYGGHLGFMLADMQ